MRRVVRSIFKPPYEVPDELDETHRIQLWHQNNQEGEYIDENEAFNYDPQDDLSLRL